MPRTVTATCTAEKEVVGGGFVTSGYNAGMNMLAISTNTALSDKTWTVTGDDNWGGSTSQIAAFAICI